MSEIAVILREEKIPIDPLSAAFAHGYGLFETIHYSQGYLYFWEAHWQRLVASSKALNIPLPFSAEAVFEAARELVPEMGAQAAVKLSLLANDGKPPQLLVYSRLLRKLPESIGLTIDSAYPINERSVLAGHKTHNYMENRLVAQSASAAGCYDAVRLNTRGEIAECAFSNLLFVVDGQIKTPALETGILPGVVRQSLIQAADIEIGQYRLEELLKAEAIFLTNSNTGALPVDWLLYAGDSASIPSARTESYSMLRELYDIERVRHRVELG